MSAIKSTSLRVLRAKPFSNNNARIFNTAERSVGMAATTRTTPSHPSTNLRYPTPVQYYAPQPNAITKTTTNPNPPTSQNAFQQLQNILSSHLASHPASALSPTLPALFSLLRSYTSDAMDWSKFAHANASKQYTRNLVCEVPGLFNLLLLVWTPGKRSPVHDHADSHCLMKVCFLVIWHWKPLSNLNQILKGNLIETRFAIPTNPGLDGPLLQTSRKNFARDQVTYMSDSVSHIVFSTLFLSSTWTNSSSAWSPWNLQPESYWICSELAS